MNSNEKNYDLFISYCRKDSDTVYEIASTLRALGLSVFLDIWELKLGDKLVYSLEEAISRSKAGLVFFSNDALKSGWVQEEYQRLITHSVNNLDFRFIPILLDKCTLPGFASNRLYYEFDSLSSETLEELTKQILCSLGKDISIHNYISNPNEWTIVFKLAHKLLFTLKAFDIERNMSIGSKKPFKPIWRIADILRRGPNFPLRVVGDCECGGVVYCGYADMGAGTFYFDSFFHICDTCFYHEYTYERNSSMTDELPQCPWCNYDWCPPMTKAEI